MPSECPLCGRPDVEALSSPGDPLSSKYLVKCPTCGDFRITDTALAIMSSYATKNYLLSGSTRNYYERNRRPLLLNSENINASASYDELISMFYDNRVSTKTRLIMEYIKLKSAYPGATVEINLDVDYSIGYCKNRDELWHFLKYLRERGLLEPEGTLSSAQEVTLTVDGWSWLEENENDTRKGKQAFLAMCFREDLNEIFLPIINEIEEATGFNIVRIDRRDFNGKICDEIIKEINKSRFVIADVTGHRQGVYFEAGYGMGMNIPVIWTCKKDEIREAHFDTRQYNHILWENQDDLRNRLIDRINATIR